MCAQGNNPGLRVDHERSFPALCLAGACLSDPAAPGRNGLSPPTQFRARDPQLGVGEGWKKIRNWHWGTLRVLRSESVAALPTLLTQEADAPEPLEIQEGEVQDGRRAAYVSLHVAARPLLFLL